MESMNARERGKGVPFRLGFRKNPTEKNGDTPVVREGVSGFMTS
jgi:hypothetical protein